MAGSISLSLSQQFDSLGAPLNGGLLYFYAAGTTTPQSAYQDYGLTIPWPNPITLDSAGRIPQLFFADGYIKVRLTDANGVIQINSDYILVIGPSSGSGGGGGVDATTIAATGDLKHTYGVGNLTGWVRCNGRTIGSATSGATERANSDTQSLFEYLWQNDSNLSVSGGRGASSTADWAANKNITLPDLRGRGLAGLDDMGNSTAGRLTSTYFGSAATTLGIANGSESRTLTLAQLPTGITASGSNSISVSAPSGNSYPVTANTVSSGLANGTGGSFPVPTSIGSFSSATGMSGSNTITVTSTNTGGTAHAIVQPTMLVTIYMKL